MPLSARGMSLPIYETRKFVAPIFLPKYSELNWLKKSIRGSDWRGDIVLHMTTSRAQAMDGAIIRSAKLFLQ